MKVRPLYGSRVVLQRDDFLLRSRRDNDTSAGAISRPHRGRPRYGAGRLGERRRKRFPRRREYAIYGGAPGYEFAAAALGKRSKRHRRGPLGRQTVELAQRRGGVTTLAGQLAQLELPLETADAAAGYLYFQIPAKVKRKHLELSYDGEFGEFVIASKAGVKQPAQRWPQPHPDRSARGQIGIFTTNRRSIGTRRFNVLLK